MVFIHVIRGRPSGLLQFPVGEAVKISFASVPSGIRAMCPNRDRRLDWTMAERWGCLVNLLTSSLRTCWCQLKLSEKNSYSAQRPQETRQIRDAEMGAAVSVITVYPLYIFRTLILKHFLYIVQPPTNTVVIYVAKYLQQAVFVVEVTFGFP